MSGNELRKVVFTIINPMMEGLVEMRKEMIENNKYINEYEIFFSRTKLYVESAIKQFHDKLEEIKEKEEEDHSSGDCDSVSDYEVDEDDDMKCFNEDVSKMVAVSVLKVKSLKNRGFTVKKNYDSDIAIVRSVAAEA